MPLLAVHIADGVLNWPWLAGGFAITIVLGWLGAGRFAMKSSARRPADSRFLCRSQIHVRIGPTSVHLLLNGGRRELGWRAALAIPVGLLLQATLLGHAASRPWVSIVVVMLIPAPWPGRPTGHRDASVAAPALVSRSARRLRHVHLAGLPHRQFVAARRRQLPACSRALETALARMVSCPSPAMKRPSSGPPSCSFILLRWRYAWPCRLRRFESTAGSKKR